MPSPRLLLALAPLLLAACVNTDAAVFVEASIEAPSAAVAGSALGATVTGEFTLKLHLGPRATSSSQVALGSFSLQDAGKKAAIVPTIEVTPKDGQAFPVTVDLDSDVTVPFAFDLGKKTLPAEDKTRLCDPAGVVVGGVIEDSLQNTSTPVSSAVFQPTGC